MSTQVARSTLVPRRLVANRRAMGAFYGSRFEVNRPNIGDILGLVLNVLNVGPDEVTTVMSL